MDCSCYVWSSVHLYVHVSAIIATAGHNKTSQTRPSICMIMVYLVMIKMNSTQQQEAKRKTLRINKQKQRESNKKKKQKKKRNRNRRNIIWKTVRSDIWHLCLHVFSKTVDICLFLCSIFCRYSSVFCLNWNCS